MDGKIIFRGALALWLISAPVSVAVEATVDFARQIKPILESKCYRCHGDEKVKGELRLDSPESILHGGDSGEVLIPGEPNESIMYLMTTYPKDDPDYMPQKGKGLSKGEQDLLKKWIEEGARFGDDVVVESTSRVKAKFEEADPKSELKYQITGDAVDIVERLKRAGLQVDTVNHDASQFEISFTYAERKPGSFAIDEMKDLADAIVHLDFSRTNVTYEDLSNLSMFGQTQYLDLSRTNIDDRAMDQIGKLTNLKYLNLRDTNVSDEGILKLGKLANLERLYLWGTQVTANGAEMLEKRLPRVRINLGGELESAPRRVNAQTY